ncbi:MAG: MoaD/ThiS family protein [Jatrophihabitans sp.]|nr:MAG: MoaD/ThiS family protein [Jatrophihabitans sp.]
MAEMTVRYWAGAQRAAGLAEETMAASTIGDLRAVLASRPAFDRLARVVTFLVDGQQAGDASSVPAGAVVDVLPPFAGG